MTTVTAQGSQVAPTTTNTGTGATISPWLRALEPVGSDGGYDPDKYYTKATDWRGHGERVVVKLPPELYVQLQVMVHEEDLVDYAMPADFVRDAIVHHLHARADQLAAGQARRVLADAIKLVDFQEASARMKADAERWTSIHEDLRETMTTLQRDEAYGQMRIMLETYAEFADGFPEPYHGKTIDAIEEWRRKLPPVVDLE